MSDNTVIAPKWVRCVDFRATSEPLQAEPKDRLSTHFATKIADSGNRVFRATTDVFDAPSEDSEARGLYVRLVHLVCFTGDPLEDGADEETVRQFIESSVMPALFPYIAEGFDAGNARVRPDRVIHVSYDYGHGLTLKRSDASPPAEL